MEIEHLHGLRTIADLGENWLLAIGYWPLAIYRAELQLGGVHVVVGAEGDAVRSRVDMRDVSRLAQGDTETLALTDGIVDVAFVTA